MANIAFNNLFYFNKRKQLNSKNNDKTDDDDDGDKLSKLLKLCRPLSIILHRLTDEEIDHWQDSHRYIKTYNKKLSSKLNDDSDDKSIKTPTPSSSSLSLSSSTASTASSLSTSSSSSSSTSPIIKKNFTRIKEKSKKRKSRWARGFIKKKIPTRKSVARNRLISSSSSSSSNVTDLNSASSVSSTSTTLSLKKVNNETEEDDSGNDNTITNKILTNNNKENKNDNDADDHCEWKFKRKFNTLINSDSDDVSSTASLNKKVKTFHPNKLLSTSSSNESIDEPNDNSNDNNIINSIDKQNNVTNDVVIKKENIINHELLNDETSNDCQIIAADNIASNNVQDDNDSSKCRDVIEINIENVGTEDSSMITDDDDDDDDDDGETINSDVPEIEKTLENDDTSLHENIVNSNESILNNKTSNINDDDLTKNNNIINNDDNETELVNEYLTDDNIELKRLCEIKMAKVVLQRVEPNDIINNEKDNEDEDLTDSDIDEESYINYEPDNNYDKNIEAPLLTVKSKVSIDNFNNDNLYKKRLSNNQTSASPDNSASEDNDSDYEPSSLSNVSVTSENTINASKKTTSDNDSGSFTSAMSSNELFNKLPANENDRIIVDSEQLIVHQPKINKTAIEQQNTLNKTTNNTQQFNDQTELLNVPNNTITIQENEQQKNSLKSPNKNKTSTCNKCSENLLNNDSHVCSSPGSSNTPSKNNRVKKNQNSPRSNNNNKSKKKKDKKLRSKVESCTCLVCTLTLDTPEQLSEHLFKHTKKELRESFRNKKYESNVPLFSDASTSDESDKEIERLQKNNNDINFINEKTDKIKVCQCHDVNNNDTTNVQIEMVLYCETCSVLFRRNECFELHYRYNVKCNENRAKGKLPQLFCTTCCIVLRSLGDMRKHLEDHASKDTHGTVNFVCNICKVIFFGIGTVFCTHWFSHEKDPNFVASRYSFPKLCVNDSIKLPDGAYPDEKYISVAEYVCKYCGSQFSMASEVSRHIENDGCHDKNNKKNNTDKKINHDKELTNDANKKIDNVNQNNTIPIVISPKITISTRSSLTNMITTKAFRPILPAPVPSKTPPKTPTKTTTNDNNSIINNKNNNLNKSPSSSSSSGAKTDMIKKFICGFCDKVFPQQSLFDDHTSDHLQSPGFPGYLCYFPKDMKAGFVCNVCRAVFTTVNELTNHWNTHNIIKFTCTVCNESFSSMSVLYRHVSNNCFKFDAGCRITYSLNKNICKHCKIGHNTVDELKEHKCHNKINDKKIVEAETTQPSLPIVESSKNNDKTITTTTTTTSVSTVAVADSSQSNDEGPSSTQDSEINSITSINNNNNDNDDNTQSTNKKLLEKQSVITKSSINSSISLPEKSKTRALEDPSVQVVLSNASSSNISASLVIDSQTTTSNNKPTKFSLKVGNNNNNNNNNNAEKIINNETIEYTDCDLNNIDDELLQNSRNEIDEIIRNAVVENLTENTTNESSINVNNEKINDVIISSSECENNKTIPTLEKSITNKETSEKNLPIDNDDDIQIIEINNDNNNKKILKQVNKNNNNVAIEGMIVEEENKIPDDNEKSRPSSTEHQGCFLRVKNMSELMDINNLTPNGGNNLQTVSNAKSLTDLLSSKAQFVKSPEKSIDKISEELQRQQIQQQQQQQQLMQQQQQQQQQLHQQYQQQQQIVTRNLQPMYPRTTTTTTTNIEERRTNSMMPRNETSNQLPTPIYQTFLQQNGNDVTNGYQNHSQNNYMTIPGPYQHPLTCMICMPPRIFNTPDEYKRHHSIHYQSNQNSQLPRQQQQQQQQPPPPPYEAPSTSTTTTSSQINPTNNSSESRRYTCKLCRVFSSLNKQEVATHVGHCFIKCTLASRHNAQLTQARLNHQLQQQMQIVQANQLLDHGNCDITQQQNHQIQIAPSVHINNNNFTNLPILSCPICTNFKYTRMEELEQHVQIFHSQSPTGGLLQCRHCRPARFFSTQELLSTHEATCHPHACNICMKLFSSAGELRNHLLSHMESGLLSATPC